MAYNKLIDLNLLSNFLSKIKSLIPTKTSDLENDSEYITGMEILSYGNSTWNDFLTAYTAKKVVYCRASSNSNPASGSQTRLAFMAYVNNADNPTNVEFQYYRSVSSHTSTQQGDQVFVYKLDKTSGWSVTTREASSKVVAGTNMTSSYSNDTVTLNASIPSNVSDLTNDSGYITGITSSDVTTALGYTPSNVDLLNNYRTTTEQNEIDDAQDERLDAVEQTMTETIISPTTIATFNASVANMPFKRLIINIEPTQEAETPTSENPLPITGWTGVNIFDDPKYTFSVNWNQFRTDTSQTRTVDGITTKYNPQTHLFTITNNSRTTNFGSGSTQCTVSSVDPIPGHKYALLGEYHPGVCVSTVNDNNTIRTTANVGRIMTMNASTATMFKLRITSNYDFVSTHPVGDVYSFYLNIVDITQLLGEEAAATATYDQIAEMFPNDWYPYNAGEITCVGAVNGDPYRKISVNWQNEAGTVYGGTLDVVNRKLNSYPYYSSYNGETIIGPWISSMDVYAPGATPTLGAQVVDMGGAATSYDLSDVPEITTLLGENNIWADCGSVTITYGAYLAAMKDYNDQFKNSILSAIAPLETTYTASRNYSVGEFLFVNTKFYKVISTISEDGIITPGTNVIQTTVAEQLINSTV